MSRQPKPEAYVQRAWKYFTERPAADLAINTYALPAPEAPKGRLQRFLSLTPQAVVKAGTEGLYNADQIFFTPARTLLFVVAGMAVMAGAAEAISAAALVSIPFIAYAAIALAAVFIIGSFIRALLVKPKDPVSLFRELFTEDEKAALPTIEVSQTDTEKVEAKLYASTLRVEKTVPAQYFLSAFYEIETKPYLSNIALTKDEYDAHEALTTEAEKAARRIALLNEKASIAPTVARKAAEDAELQKAREAGSISYRWEKLKLLFRKHYSSMSYFEIVRETGWVPFKFLFGGAMAYWAVWLFAALLGAGFVGAGLASEALLPFGSAWLAFVIPLGVAVVLGIARAINAYQQRNVPKNHAETKNLAEALFQSTAARKIANQQLQAVAPEEARRLANATLEERTAKLLQTKPAPAKARNAFWYAIATLFVTDYSIRTMLNSSRAGAVLRVITHTVTRFATGFILAFISLWPLCDFGILSLGGPAVLLIGIQFCIAIASGLLFAGYSLVKQIPDEKARLDAFSQIKADRPLYTTLVDLENRLDVDRAKLTDLEKKVDTLILTRIQDRARDIAKKDIGLNAFQRWLKISTYFNQAKAEVYASCSYAAYQAQGRNVIAHDNWAFTGRFNLKEKSFGIKVWTQIKKGFDLGNEALAAGGSGGLMVRLAIGASGLGLGLFGGAIGFGTPVIIALAVFGFVWASIRVFKLLDSKNVRAAKQALTRGTQAAQETMVAELEILQARTLQLEAIKRQSTPSAAAAESAEIEAANPLAAAPAALVAVGMVMMPADGPVAAAALGRLQTGSPYQPAKPAPGGTPKGEGRGATATAQVPATPATPAIAIPVGENPHTLFAHGEEGAAARAAPSETQAQAPAYT